MILRSRSARRAVRVFAGVVATFLISGNVLVAAGLCIVKSPPAVQAATQAATQAAGETPCPQHLIEDTSPAPVAQHCPADDSSAQARTADLPSVQLLAAAAVAPIGGLAAAVSAPEIRSDPGTPQRPLYARLQRLQL
jgi:hypothetical protein